MDRLEATWECWTQNRQVANQSIGTQYFHCGGELISVVSFSYTLGCYREWKIIFELFSLKMADSSAFLC